MIVRPCEPKDFDGVLTLIKYMVDELGQEDAYDHNTALENLRYNATHDQYFLFVILEGSRPVGFASGMGTYYNDYSAEHHCHVSLFYILSSHRNKKTADELFGAVNDWATRIDARYYSVKPTHIIDLDELVKDDFRKAEIYMKEM